MDINYDVSHELISKRIITNISRIQRVNNDIESI